MIGTHCQSTIFRLGNIAHECPPEPPFLLRLLVSPKSRYHEFLAILDLSPSTAQMFTPLCALPLPAELFALAIHPTESLLALGLATGHVVVDRLPTYVLSAQIHRLPVSRVLS